MTDPRTKLMPWMGKWGLPIGVGFLAFASVCTLVAWFVAARLGQIEDRMDKKLDELSEIESQRALNAAQCLDTAESGATKRSASSFALLRARQDKLEQELVRKADIDGLATRTQVDYLSARMRAQLQKLIAEIRKPLSHLPKAK